MHEAARPSKNLTLPTEALRARALPAQPDPGGRFGRGAKPPSEENLLTDLTYAFLDPRIRYS